MAVDVHNDPSILHETVCPLDKPPRQVSLVVSSFLKKWVNKYSKNEDLAKCVKTEHQMAAIDWQNGPDKSVINAHDSSVSVVGLVGDI